MDADRLTSDSSLETCRTVDRIDRRILPPDLFPVDFQFLSQELRERCRCPLPILWFVDDERNKVIRSDVNECIQIPDSVRGLRREFTLPGR